MCSYSLVHASFEAIDILLREVINGHSLIDRTVANSLALWFV